MRLFGRKKDEREWGDPPWLRKTKRVLLTLGALLISAALLLFVLGIAISLGIGFLLAGFLCVALTVPD